MPWYTEKPTDNTAYKVICSSYCKQKAIRNLGWSPSSVGPPGFTPPQLPSPVDELSASSEIKFGEPHSATSERKKKHEEENSDSDSDDDE